MNGGVGGVSSPGALAPHRYDGMGASNRLCSSAKNTATGQMSSLLFQKSSHVATPIWCSASCANIITRAVKPGPCEGSLTQSAALYLYWLFPPLSCLGGKHPFVWETNPWPSARKPTRSFLTALSTELISRVLGKYSAAPPTQLSTTRTCLHVSFCCRKGARISCSATIFCFDQDIWHCNLGDGLKERPRERIQEKSHSIGHLLPKYKREPHDDCTQPLIKEYVCVWPASTGHLISHTPTHMMTKWTSMHSHCWNIFISLDREVHTARQHLINKTLLENVQ